MLSAPFSPRFQLWFCFTTSVILASAMASHAFADSPWLQLPSMTYTPAYHAMIGVGSQLEGPTRLYVLGGEIGSGPINKALVFDMAKDGTTGMWSESPNELPQGIAEHAIVLTDRRVYLLGGTNGKTTLRTTLSAEIPSNGQIGPWRSEPILLPVSLRGHSAALMGRDVFVFGGKDEGGKVRDQVFRSAEDSSGRLQNWTLVGVLPQPMAYAASVSNGNRVYLLGGEDSKGPIEAVWSGSLSPAGELTWKKQPPLPKPLSRGSAFTSANSLYYVGGYDGSGVSSESYRAATDEGGNTGPWANWVPLPFGVMGLQNAVVNGRVFLAGGNNGARFVSSLQTLPLDDLVRSEFGTSPLAGSTPDMLTTAIAGVMAIGSLLIVAVALSRNHHS